MPRIDPIQIQPYSDHAAMAVLKALDPADQLEANAVRGYHATHLELFADWRAINAARVLSVVLVDARRMEPFAVLALGNTGQAGVAQAAFLARNHTRFRRQIACAAAQIRRDMPGFCAEAGIRRIEARCWSDHPTAAQFLKLCSFHHEADMPGFGGANAPAIFRQFAWVRQTV
ncbi:MAG: hypothetical protein CML69_10820 [Rhodobacteraceae bacterium]|nr:hypothetical protein [Paracoccaceae bacterium]